MSASVAGPRPASLEAWTAVCDLVDSVRVQLNRELQATVGLTLSENLLLCQVAMSPGGRERMAMLAQRLGVAKSGVTKTADRLEGAGLLRREHGPDDRRQVFAVLTETGSRAFEAARPAYVAAVERHFVPRVPASELRALAGLVRKQA